MSIKIFENPIYYFSSGDTLPVSSISTLSRALNLDTGEKFQWDGTAWRQGWIDFSDILRHSTSVLSSGVLQVDFKYSKQILVEFLLNDNCSLQLLNANNALSAHFIVESTGNFSITFPTATLCNDSSWDSVGKTYLFQEAGIFEFNLLKRTSTGDWLLKIETKKHV